MRHTPLAIVAVFAIFAAALMVEGCGEKTASAPPAAKVRDSLAKQLATMTPDQRMEYVRQHPEALGALSGTPAVSKSP